MALVLVTLSGHTRSGGGVDDDDGAKVGTQ
jgi:hypothetical protein